MLSVHFFVFAGMLSVQSDAMSNIQLMLLFRGKKKLLHGMGRCAMPVFVIYKIAILVSLKHENLPEFMRPFTRIVCEHTKRSISKLHV